MENPWAITLFVVFLIEAIFIIFANIISLVIFVRKFRQVKTYMLLINLSVADLMVGFFTVLISMNHLEVAMSSHSSVSNDQVCYGTLQALKRAFPDLVILESCSTLVLIAVERAYAVIKPIRHRVIKTKYYQIGILLTWCISSVPAICLIVMRCDKALQLLVRISLVNGLGLIYLLLMFLCYVAIYVKLRFYPVFQHNANTQMQVRLCKTLFLATIASAIAYIPFCILDLYKGVIKSTALYLNIYMTIALLFVCSNSFVNCLIYAWKMPAFRNELKRVFKYILCKSSVIGDNVGSRRNMAVCHNAREGMFFELTPVKHLGQV